MEGDINELFKVLPVLGWLKARASKQDASIKWGQRRDLDVDPKVLCQFGVYLRSAFEISKPDVDTDADHLKLAVWIQVSLSPSQRRFHY